MSDAAFLNLPLPAGKRNDAIRYADLLKCKACKLSTGHGSRRVEEEEEEKKATTTSAIGEVYRDPCNTRRNTSGGKGKEKIDEDDIQD